MKRKKAHVIKSLITSAKFFLLSKNFWIALHIILVVLLLEKLDIELRDPVMQKTAYAIINLLKAACVEWARRKVRRPRKSQDAKPRK